MRISVLAAVVLVLTCPVGIAKAQVARSSNDDNSMRVDEPDYAIDATFAGDPIGARDAARAADARWFIVAGDTESIMLVDRRTIQQSGQRRLAWTMVMDLRPNQVPTRTLTHLRWDCVNRTSALLSLVSYDKFGKHESYTAPRNKPEEAIAPETFGEAAFEFVCGDQSAGDIFPAPVSRDPVQTARVLSAYIPIAKGLSGVGVLIATLDPLEDRDRLKSLLTIVPKNKRHLVLPVIWNEYPPPEDL